MSKPTFDSKIAAALKANGSLRSTDLAVLIQETETAAQTADTEVEQLRARALDPTNPVDVTQASAALDAAELTRDRLRAALHPLQERLQQVEAVELADRWRADFERVEAQRDAMVEDLRCEYPVAVQTIVDLLARMAVVEREVVRINHAAPYGVRDRLTGVEDYARDGLPPIASQLKLPKFEFDRATDPGFAWPPHEPPIVTMPHGYSPGPAWREDYERRLPLMRAEQERQVVLAEQRQRDAREREKAEATVERRLRQEEIDRRNELVEKEYRGS